MNDYITRGTVLIVLIQGLQIYKTYRTKKVKGFSILSRIFVFYNVYYWTSIFYKGELWLAFWNNCLGCFLLFIHTIQVFVYGNPVKETKRSFKKHIKKVKKIYDNISRYN